MGTFLSSPGLSGEAGRPLRAAYFTLGCKLNYAETSTIGGRLRESGIEEAMRGEEPDVCVVNTCSVTEMADKKARSLIRRIARRYPGAFLIVTGCYAQLKPGEVASIEGVNLVLGSKEKLDIGAFLPDIESYVVARALDPGAPGPAPVVRAGEFSSDDSFAPSCSRGDRTRFFLKVQDGCDYFCSYCTIPYARGRSRSGLVGDIVAQARRAADEGGREIVITGVNIGDFGRNTGERLEDLLRELDAVEGISRFRISSIEPNLLSDGIIRWIARESRAFMPHFHIPLQSGSDTVLRLMNRRYSTSLFAERIGLIRSLIPDAFIGVDVIAGARGETSEEWEKAYRFVEGLGITRLHVFPYSERPGTAALLLGDVVPREERARRASELGVLSSRKLEDFMLANVGSHRPVLWEHPVAGSGLMSGLTDNYIRVVAPLRPALLNAISTVRIEGIARGRIETMEGSHID